MKCAERLRRHYILAVLQHDCIQTEIALHAYMYIQTRRRRRGQRNRTCWVKPWIQRRREYGLYDHLLVELRREDQTEFINLMRMPPEMFDELLERVGIRISKHRTWYREPLCHHSPSPGLWFQVRLPEVRIEGACMYTVPASPSLGGAASSWGGAVDAAASS